MELDEGESEILDAYIVDAYVTMPDRMSLKGMVSMGFSGAHELVSGGYSQVSLLISLPSRSTCR